MTLINPPRITCANCNNRNTVFLIYECKEKTPDGLPLQVFNHVRAAELRATIEYSLHYCERCGMTTFNEVE